MLELHKFTKVLDVVMFPITLFLFYNQGWQGGVFKVIKNGHFLVFLVVLFIFHKFISE